ncbi:hypothetical protein L218DRAFT_555465 [Marasmius fiardii PR-910]|nr:hypothetical protein L218DRAFT_555465 [Marasmius fiardii PR-910]
MQHDIRKDRDLKSRDLKSHRRHRIRGIVMTVWERSSQTRMHSLGHTNRIHTETQKQVRLK